MGTRALISINGKVLIATHWDGYPSSLGRELLQCETLEQIIEVARRHTIDSAADGLVQQPNKAVSSIDEYRDTAEWQYDRCDGQWMFKRLFVSFSEAATASRRFLEDDRREAQRGR